MNKLKMYRICLHDKNYSAVKKLGYIPVGLGKDIFSEGWLKGNQGENISEKNKYYGEYTFHYWFNKYTKPLLWPIIFFNINPKS